MAANIVQRLISEHPVTIFSKSYCPYSKKVKELFASLKAQYHAEELDLIPNGAELQEALASMTGQKTVPNVFVNGKHIGGSDKSHELAKSGELQEMLKGDK